MRLSHLRALLPEGHRDALSDLIVAGWDLRSIFVGEASVSITVRRRIASTTWEVTGQGADLDAAVVSAWDQAKRVN